MNLKIKIYIFFMCSITNEIYTKIFDELYRRREDILKEHKVDICEKMPDFYQYFPPEEQIIPILDKYVVELENNGSMTFYIDKDGHVYDCKNKHIGKYEYKTSTIILYE